MTAYVAVGSVAFIVGMVLMIATARLIMDANRSHLISLWRKPTQLSFRVLVLRGMAFFLLFLVIFNLMNQWGYWALLLWVLAFLPDLVFFGAHNRHFRRHSTSWA